MDFPPTFPITYHEQHDIDTAILKSTTSYTQARCARGTTCPSQSHALLYSSASGRQIADILPCQVFLNIVLDEAVEQKPDGSRERVGQCVIRGNSVVMIEVCLRSAFPFLFSSLRSAHDCRREANTYPTSRL